MATAGERHPTEGVRLILELESSDSERAVYAASVYTPDASFHYRAELVSGGEATLVASAEPAAADDEKKLSNLVRATARNAARKSADGLDPWPPRILRWRGPGRG